MNYKVGDKVKIKTWEEMKKEFGLYSHTEDKYDMIDGCHGFAGFLGGREKALNKEHPNRILIIEKIEKNGTYLANIKNKKWSNGWADEMIECLAKDYKEPIPIQSRFELLDL